jgi:hypothetical protein
LSLKKPIYEWGNLHASHNNDFFLNPKEGLHKYNFQKSKYLFIYLAHVTQQHPPQGTISKKWGFEPNGMTKVVEVHCVFAPLTCL